MSGDRAERGLRERGPRELGGSMPSLPADVDEARTRLRMIDRRRGVRSLVAAGLGTVAVGAVAVVVALAVTMPPGPTPGPLSGSGTPGVIASGSSAASAGPTVPASAAPAVSPCHVAQMRAVIADGWGGAAGSVGAMLQLTNNGSASCVLSGRPGAVIEAGATTLVRAEPDAATGASVVLPPGKVAITSVRWSNWCLPRPSGGLAVRLLFADGVAVAVEPDPSAPDVAVPPCVGQGQASSLSTIDFQLP